MNQTKISPITQKLISFQTVSTHTKEINQGLVFINHLLQSSGLTTRRLEHSGTQLLWTTNHQFSHPDLLLLCHLDVVSATAKQFLPQIKADQLIGRGAFDMKGSLATMISVLTTIKTNKSIQLLVTTDEEIGGNNGAGWFFHHTKLAPKTTLVPDGLEENQIILKQKGPIHLVIEAIGQPTHASKPWLGTNPVKTLFTIINRIESMEKQGTNARQWRPTFTPTQFEANTSINQLAATATITFDIRVTNQQQIANIKKIVREEGGKITRQFGDGKLFIQKKAPIISKWQRIAHQITSKPTKTSFSSGGSDARHLPSTTQTIITQVKGGDAHGPNEWVSINSLHQLFDITTQFINSI